MLSSLPMATIPSSLLVRKQICVRGIVQGVGFRPFVYGLAATLGLAGHVLNSSAGVSIEIEGADQAVDEFLLRLKENAPPLSTIEDLSVAAMNPLGEVGFSIRASHAHPGEFVLISPDVATCADCCSEFGDPQDRRFLYPFTNCTNCGPRYTIVRDIPYDRPKTTMATFPMCAQCQAEYDDPGDRRFHAQPNACARCGPALSLVGGEEAGESSFDAQASSAILGQARLWLREGKILAIKGLGGFLLACDAENDTAVRQLRERKRRSDKPFALMARDTAAIEKFCMVSAAERASLESCRRPIVVLSRRAEAAVSRHVAPGNNTVGVMLPYTPLHYLLFADSSADPSAFTALVMTSGNLSEEPIVVSNQEALRQLAPVADCFHLAQSRYSHARGRLGGPHF